MLWLHAAAPEDRMRFQFRFFLVYSLSSATRTTAATQATVATPIVKASSRDPCAKGSYLQFYDGPQEAPRALGPPICGLTIPAPFTSSGPWLGLRLVTRGRQPRVDFLSEVTSFRLEDGSCGTYFRCRSGICVPWSLLCDDWNMDNCGDGSDQDSRPPASCRGQR
ncbi:Low density lipoprotein receptor class A domain-containing 2 [Apodemus speciosus]|uniref:Low density lipoprotein receptor class A domain-containing 2 n=1 Tax=Apodemus speciosus TaxID=105296 RepID=A0ABQ0EQI7_APOSI